jgi:hypothetical protein
MLAILAEFTLEAVGTGAAGMLGLVAVTATSLAYFRRRNGHQSSPTERLERKVDSLSERVSEMHGTIKMLPCVKQTSGPCIKQR